jgi:ubiquinone/menaquinone biosynthesis C-methylase UbiE
MNIVSLIRDRSQPEPLSREPEDEHLDQELENILNHPAPPYSDGSYWNTRYEREPDPFDWYQSWSRLKPIILPLLPVRGVALDLGCGNSPMTAELLEDGFDEVYGLDISSVVIRQNEERFRAEPRVKWICGECMKMDSLESGKFDVVFDKGTLDSLMCAGPSAKVIGQMMTEIARVLKPGGIFVEVSYGTPNTRLSFLKGQYGWTVLENKEIEKMTEKNTYHYIYLATKNAEGHA